ncbi:YraN family protein [Candidatus Uhrbacteria bacterium]|nr:YraN family protein [Candidatus Uhrbacteria bacterium]
MDRAALGLLGERAAELHLRRRGWSVIGRRVRTRSGEIDLVAMDGGEVVFIEVKTRRGDAFGPPEESITFRKRQKMRRAAHEFLRGRDLPYRIDVIAVEIRGGTARIRHYKAAVGEG